MTRLFVFDMDGTLLPKTTALVEIAKIMGHQAYLENLEKEYVEKKIGNQEFAHKCYHIWQNLTPEIVEQAFQTAPKMSNIRKVLDAIKASGGVTCLITAAPHFFAELFKTFGFEHIFASEPYCLQERKFRPEQVLYGYDKPIIAKRLCEKLNYEFENTIAFGDSLSDLPLFEALKHTLSVNGDDHIKPFAKYHYTGLDLDEAYQHITSQI